IRDFHVTGVQTCALPISAPVEPEATESNAAEAEPVVASDIELPVNEAEANAFIEIETLLEEAEAAANNTESSRFEREAGQIDDRSEERRVGKECSNRCAM